MTQIASDERWASGAYSCCATAAAHNDEQPLNALADILARYVNDYAASVKVYAVK